MTIIFIDLFITYKKFIFIDLIRLLNEESHG